jgi:hypothetical protein
MCEVACLPRGPNQQAFAPRAILEYTSAELNFW